MSYSRVVEKFLELVKIDSVSLEESKIASFIATELEQLGFEVDIDSAGERLKGDAGNIIACLKGSPGMPAILFSAHMDTVEPGRGIDPQVEDGIIRSNGETILGADDKSGIAIALELAYRLREENLSSGDVLMVFTVAEEKGLLGSKNLDFSQMKADYGYVLDCDGEAGKIVVHSPSQNSIKATFIGKSAHAGVCPERGINAIQAAAVAISKMDLGKLDKDSTANIGVIKGGLAGNIVPAKVIVEGETRSFSSDKLKNQTDKMHDLLKLGAEQVGAQVDIEVERAYETFNLSPEDEVVKVASRAMTSVGFEADLASSGGGSDANIFNKAGISCVGLSVGVCNPHSTDEMIKIADLEKGADILVEIVKQARKRTEDREQKAENRRQRTESDI